MLIQSRGAALLAFIVIALLTLVLAARLLARPAVDAALLTGKTQTLAGSSETAASDVALVLRQVQNDASWSLFNAPAGAAVGGGWTLSWSLPQGSQLNGAASLSAQVQVTNPPVLAVVTAPDGTVVTGANVGSVTAPSGVPLAFSIQLEDGQGYPVAPAGLTLTWQVSPSDVASITQDGILTAVTNPYGNAEEATVTLSAVSTATGQTWQSLALPTVDVNIPAPTQWTCGYDCGGGWGGWGGDGYYYGGWGGYGY